ncbi:hypothetical protein HNQ08_005143 [Deinococcus humi]|uniref:Uncharacterized protein n=1 Tax=Deinococcus humi TaxID=662880 RepID=A0A7W8NJD4_9DEIO|nr:hypothetical protein [Deinococcus humi]
MHHAVHRGAWPGEALWVSQARAARRIRRAAGVIAGVTEPKCGRDGRER